MLTSTSDLLARAKAYVDADDVNAGAWIDDSLWLSWMNQEYYNLYRALIRNGLLGPQFIDYDFQPTGSEFYVLPTEPLAVAGVAQLVTGSYPRPLAPMQVARGRYPWYNQNGILGGNATHWIAHYAPAGGIEIGLQPQVGAGGDMYRVRMVPAPPVLVLSAPGAGQSLTVNFPHGTEERIALGMARRAYEREGVVSPSVERLCQAADEEMSRAAAELLEGQSPRVRNVDYENRGWRRRGQDMAPVTWTASPQLWWWAP